MQYISSTFSFKMFLPYMQKGKIDFEVIEPEQIPTNVRSLIHYKPVAQILTFILGRQINCSEESVQFEDGDVLYIAKISGGNLPQGIKVLPEGYEITFLKMTIHSDES